MQTKDTNNKRILLHACCGPCSLEPTRLLQEKGYKVHIYYFNPNIWPSKEYEHRFNTLLKWTDDNNIDVIEGNYDADAWNKTVGSIAPVLNQSTDKQREKRCRACYKFRFEETAKYAKENSFDTIGTTLSVSPYQYTKIIEEELKRAANKYKLNPHFEDYRPYYNQATVRSRQLNMYRQNYCGCSLSAEESAYARKLRKIARQQEKIQLRAKRSKENDNEREILAIKKAEKQEYAKKQARKRAILRQLRQEAKSANK